MSNILVTGGSGFVGSHLKLKKPDWTYLSSKECDLTDPTEVRNLLGDLRPEAIVHLAAKVGGIKENTEKQADFYQANIQIDSNVLHQANLLGINRILSSLSTCSFPENVEHPFSEKDLLEGPPTRSNMSYGMCKRMLHIGSIAYRNQYGRNYSTFCPSNVYGPGDHFGEEGSHFVASLVHKCAKAKNGDKINFWGSGNPLRQQLYVGDLVEIIIKLLDSHHSEEPLIVAPNENLSIKEMVEIGLRVSNKRVSVKFDGKFDGQHRKDGCNESLLQLIGNYDFTLFEEGFRRAYESYAK